VFYRDFYVSVFIYPAYASKCNKQISVKVGKVKKDYGCDVVYHP